MKKIAKQCYALLLGGAIGVALASGTGVSAQDPPTGGGQERPAGGAGGGPGQQREPEIKPFERVITKDAKSDEGVFTVHRMKDNFYYEIPKAELGKEFLWVSQIARTTLGVGYRGQAMGNRVVEKWERRDNRVLLRGVSYAVVADPKEPVAKAVEAANNNPIIMSFFIEALGKDDSVVIDVTRLFTSEVTEFNAKSRLRARIFKSTSRSFSRTRRFVSDQHRSRSDAHVQQ